MQFPKILRGTYRSHLLQIITAFSFLFIMGAAFADVTLPAVLDSHMVVQRQAPIHIWGWANSGEKVTVSFRNETKSTVADGAGNWQVYLSPSGAGGPFTLVVRGSNTITLNDILVGDLWIASGQSNMEMPMVGFPPTAVLKDADKEIAAANYPQIRIMRVDLTSSTYPLDNAKLASTWQVCSPETIRDFSAVGYFFARDLQAKEKVPIGVVDSTWGGTPAESWLSLSALTSNAGLLPSLAPYVQMMKNHAAELRIMREEKTLDEQAKLNGPPAPKHAIHRDLRAWQPAGLYNAMIAPLTPLPIKGVIWYQGEANRDAARAAQYGRLFPALIADWRQAWGQGDFPFLYVQISSWGPQTTPEQSVAVVREAQRRTLSVKNTGMVVSADIGDSNNIHPANKQEVGARLALAARAIAYQEPIEYSGPLFREVTVDDGSLRVWFDHADGLKAKVNPLADFEIAGGDRHFVPATAKIEGETVVVSSPAIPAPQYVRYAWDSDSKMVLQNSAGLPASPFSSDDNYQDETVP